MPVSKQTQELTFSLRALLYRLRQLLKERQSYSKAKHRELAKLLREGREDFARIKTEEVIANDDLVAALEILELHCEQLHVRANILDHLAFRPGRTKRAVPKARKREAERARRRSGGVGGTNARKEAGGGSGSGGWSLWNLFGYSGSNGGSSSSGPHTAERSVPKAQENMGPEADDANNEREGESGGLEPEEQEDEVYIEPELDKSAAVIFYAYPRIPRDITGLPELRAKLALRWGNEFANRAQEDDPPVKIPDSLVERLRVRRPSQSLVEMYLKEIARSHGIPWGQGEEEGDEDAAGGGGQERKQLDSPVKNADEPGASQKREDPKSTSPSGGNQGGDVEKMNVQSGSPSKEPKGNGIPEADELARRFAALK